ncbi:MAG TPA: hypothetical protein VF733_03005 [Candidatus Saccharimonadales bacterium]
MANPNIHPLELANQYIPNPAVEWDSSITIPRNPDAVWLLLSRVGLQGPKEAGAGWFLPQRLERFLPEKLHSVGALAVREGRLPRQREVGDRLKDFGKGAFADVVAIDHEVRALALDGHWPSKKRILRTDSEHMHYTWTLHVEPIEGTPDNAQITTRVRKETPFKRFGRVVPAVDKWGLKQLRRGLMEHLPE